MHPNRILSLSCDNVLISWFYDQAIQVLNNLIWIEDCPWLLMVTRHRYHHCK